MSKNTDRKYRLMAGIIRNYRKIRLAVMIVMLAMYVILADYVYLPVWVALIVSVISAAILIFALRTYLKYAYRRIDISISDGCDPGPFIDAYSHLIVRVEKGVAMKGSALWVRLSTGLFAAGRFSDALTALKKCELFTRTRSLKDSGRQLKMIYHANLCFGYLAQDNIENAQRQRSAFEKEMFLLKARSKKRPVVQRTYRNMTCLLRMAGGDYDGAEEVFLEALKDAKSNYERVSAQYTLGKIYTNAGQKDKARGAFTYAAENGNKLYIAVQAREKLAEMDA